MTRLKTGISVAGTEYKLGNDVVEDAVVAQWVVVTNVLRDKYSRAMTPASSSAPPTATPTASPPNTVDEDSILKTLPLDVYTKLVNDYYKIQLDGEDRTFPEKMLLGAEKALARMCTTNIISPTTTPRPLWVKSCRRGPLQPWLPSMPTARGTVLRNNSSSWTPGTTFLQRSS